MHFGIPVGGTVAFDADTIMYYQWLGFTGRGPDQSLDPK